MAHFLQITINVQKSRIQPQCTLQLKCEDRPLFVSVDEVSLCWQQFPECEQAIRLMYSPTFCKLHSSSNPTNKNRSELGLEIKQIQTAVSQ